MVTLTHYPRGPAAATGFNFPSLDSLPGSSSRVTVLDRNAIDSGIADRMRVHAADDCYQNVRSCAGAIRDFFTHGYADLRMLSKALRSMWNATTVGEMNATTLGEINGRIQELSRFKSAVWAAAPRAASAQFHNLSTGTSALFDLVTSGYMSRFQQSDELADTLIMKREILRECEVAISYQQTLTRINTFFHVFSEVLISFQTGRAAPNLIAMLHGGASRVDDETDIEPTAPEFDLEIPGTIAYVKDAIPNEIQQRADQISALQERFEALENPPDIPDGFQCPIMQSTIILPVLDASHLNVQNSLTALRAALLAGGETATIAVNANRPLRHTMDKDSLEGLMAAGRETRWGGREETVQCPVCRHPAEGGINRNYLRIDTQLQEDILQFLTRAVSPGGVPAA